MPARTSGLVACRHTRSAIGGPRSISTLLTSCGREAGRTTLCSENTERGVYADPAKIHPINHAGEFYEVAGPHLCEPSPQRTPLLFQADSSSRGRDFAAKHAECAFIIASRNTLKGATSIVKDVRARAVHQGRKPEDILFFQGVTQVVGGRKRKRVPKKPNTSSS